MKIGYARVSTLEQNLDLQLQALKKAGCKKIFREKVSGASRHRPEFQRMLDQLREGDIIVVWKLDRLARSPETFSKQRKRSATRMPGFSPSRNRGRTRRRTRAR